MSILINIMMMMILMIINLIMVTSIIMMKKMPLTSENNSPFECGFEPMESARLPFSIHFFLIGIMFLIFDIEVILIMPLLFTLTTLKTKVILIPSLLLVITMTWGLYHKWNYQSLNWTN